MNVNNEHDMGESKRTKDSEVSRRIVGITTGGKELVAYQTQQGFLRVKFTTGGQLHPIIAGKFLQYKDAEHAIHKYLALEAQTSKKKRSTKVTKNGESGSKS